MKVYIVFNMSNSEIINVYSQLSKDKIDRDFPNAKFVRENYFVWNSQRYLIDVRDVKD